MPINIFKRRIKDSAIRLVAPIHFANRVICKSEVNHKVNVEASRLQRVVQGVMMACALLCLSLNAQAVNLNLDAGALLHQSEQDFKAQKSEPKPQIIPTKPSPNASTNETVVWVKEFNFVGNRLISSAALRQLVAAYADRKLTFAQLNQAVDLVINAYREAGWTVRAYLPRQEISQGQVTIQVVEAVFGEASFTGTAPQRIDPSRLLETVQANLIKGQPLNASQVDRTLLLLDDLPGVSVSGNFVQGTHDGETNLAIAANDDSLLTGSATVDNQGSRSTGADRLSVNLSLNSPARLGDALGVNALKTQGSEYQRFGYSIPVGHDGWRAGLHTSNLTYQVVTADFTSLNPSGTATTRGWDATYPLLRSQFQNVNLALSYDDKKFDNTSGGTTTSYAIKAYNATMSANYVDSWEGGGVTNLSLGVTSGDKSTESRYTKLTLGASRLQSMTETLSVYGALSAQVANKNLDSSEKMYLGGATGVRAYPASEAGGSEGSAITLELRQRVSNTVMLTGFYDYGRVMVNRDNSTTSLANPNDFNLRGYGVTAAWQATTAIDIKATLAQRLGTNPAANSTTGMDGDGTKKITRVWLGASIAF